MQLAGNRGRSGDVLSTPYQPRILLGTGDPCVIHFFLLTVVGGRDYLYLVLRRQKIGKVIRVVQILTSSVQWNWGCQIPCRVCNKRCRQTLGRKASASDITARDMRCHRRLPSAPGMSVEDTAPPGEHSQQGEAF